MHMLHAYVLFVASCTFYLVCNVCKVYSVELIPLVLSYNDSLTVLCFSMLRICLAYSVLPVMHFVGVCIQGNLGSLHRCMR